MELKGVAITKATGLESDQTIVGVRADEPMRLHKLRARGLGLPLVDAGIHKQDVRSFWRGCHFDLELEERGGITALGNCDLCFLKGQNQLISVIADKPSRAVWWAQQEKSIGAVFHSNRPSYQQMLDYSQQQASLFDADEEGIGCFCGD